MATMLNPNAIPDGSITQEKIESSVLAGKQDTIPDLATIRTNAEKGATALQSYTETDPVYIADKPKIALKSEIPDISRLATKEEVAGKQDTLTPGNGISIKDNKIDVTTITESESQPSTHLWVNPSEDAETGMTYNRSQIDALVGAKQDTLQLTVKDNGNIVLANLQGQSKEFMPATPSGDPMHWAYVAAGAEYNDTGADITKTAPWADMVDDEADAIVIHKAGYWYLNGLGDISTAELKHLAMFDQCKYELLGKATISYLLDNCESRTFFDRNDRYLLGYMQAAIFSSNIVVIKISGGVELRDGYKVRDLASFCSISSSPLRHILGDVNCSDKDLKITIDSFSGSNIMTIKMKYLHQNIWFKNTKILTCKSILYMINNEAATTNITITLHPDTYSRAMANADIVAALEAHPNISLASA